MGYVSFHGEVPWVHEFQSSDDALWGISSTRSWEKSFPKLAFCLLVSRCFVQIRCGVPSGDPPWNWQFAPQNIASRREGIVFQPSMGRCEKVTFREGRKETSGPICCMIALTAQTGHNAVYVVILLVHVTQTSGFPLPSLHVQWLWTLIYIYIYTYRVYIYIYCLYIYVYCVYIYIHLSVYLKIWDLIHELLHFFISPFVFEGFRGPIFLKYTNIHSPTQRLPGISWMD